MLSAAATLTVKVNWLAETASSQRAIASRMRSAMPSKSVKAAPGNNKAKDALVVLGRGVHLADHDGEDSGRGLHAPWRWPADRGGP